jgi:hypothetical protein
LGRAFGTRVRQFGAGSERLTPTASLSVNSALAKCRVQVAKFRWVSGRDRVSWRCDNRVCRRGPVRRISASGGLNREAVAEHQQAIRPAPQSAHRCACVPRTAGYSGARPRIGWTACIQLGDWPRPSFLAAVTSGIAGVDRSVASARVTAQVAKRCQNISRQFDRHEAVRYCARAP